MDIWTASEESYKNGYEKGFNDKTKIIDFIKKFQVSEGFLQDWYIHSVDNSKNPVWTEEHITELFNDFILIPKYDVDDM